MEQKKYIRLYDEAIRILGINDAVIYCFLLGIGDYVPSIQNIADRCGVSVRTARTVISRLNRYGAISYNEGKGTTNVYNCVEVQNLHNQLCKTCTTRSEIFALPICKTCTTRNANLALHNNNNYKNFSKNKGNIAPEPREILMEVFCDVYKKNRGVSYVPDTRTLTNDSNELVAKLLLHKKDFMDDRSEEEFFRAFFEGCLMVSDQFELDRFSLSYICKNYNSYMNRITNNGNSRQATTDNISKYAPADILRKCAQAFGK